MSMESESAEEIFDDSSDNWARDEPKLLSDWTARPFLLNWCSPTAGKRILDLGCGEGYFTRQLARDHPIEVYGIDISSSMIKLANKKEEQESLGIQYSVGCASEFKVSSGSRFDLITAVFVYNYLTIEQMMQSMALVYQNLAEGGQFIFSLPHPVHPFLASDDARFHFNRSGGWFSGKDNIFEGTIALKDGDTVPVRCVHKIFEDIFNALREAGFRKFPELKELTVTEEIIRQDPEFFGPLRDQPLHIAIRIER